VDDFLEYSVRGFLDAVAERKPTPGGGSVAGLAGASACAMARMVAAYSASGKTQTALQEHVTSAELQLQRADQLMRALTTQDAIAYRGMTAAAKRAKEDPSASDACQEAILAAIAVPMEMGAVASTALSTMDGFKEVASRYLLSDLGVAAVLADGAAQAAAYSVRVNLSGLSNGDVRSRIRDEIGQTLDHCTKRRASIEAFVRAHLEGDADKSR